MQWIDEGIVLSVTKHGEADALIDCMTADHGRHRGFVRSGNSKRQRAILQPGNHLKLTWRSRIEENLGSFQVDAIHSPLGGILGDRLSLASLSAVLSVYSATLPERDPHVDLYRALKAYVGLLEHEDGEEISFALGLVKVERGLLNALGYGLNLSECAATGTDQELIYVSPKSAQAVSKAAGQPYRDKLLSLPSFMLENSDNPITHREVLQGLRLTGYFLDRYIWSVHGKGQPAARERFIHSLIKKAEDLSGE